MLITRASLNWFCYLCTRTYTTRSFLVRSYVRESVRVYVVRVLWCAVMCGMLEGDLKKEGRMEGTRTLGKQFFFFLLWCHIWVFKSLQHAETGNNPVLHYF